MVTNNGVHILVGHSTVGAMPFGAYRPALIAGGAPEEESSVSCTSPIR